MKNFSKECSLNLSDPLPKTRKLSQEFVEMAFSQHGYQLLSEYQRSGDKLDFICPQGHRHSIAWDHFKSGKRCAHCAGKIVTHEQVKAAFEAEGYTMLSQYQKNKTKIDFVCPQGHKFAITWAGFQSGKRCKYCAGQVVTHEQVKAAFEAEGYQLLSKYERNAAPMDFVCPQGHHHRIRWAGFNAGKRCGHCAGNRPLTHRQVKAAFEAEGYQVLSQYKKSDAPIAFICPKGHRHSTSWDSFKSGNRCIHCAGLIVTHEQVKAAFEAEGYTMLSQYQNTNAKIDFVCPWGHRHSMSWHKFQSGARCGLCFSGGYKSDRPGILYYVRFDLPEHPVWKIGITNLSIARRFCEEKSPRTVLAEWRYEDGSIPPQLEKQILATYKHHQYQGKALQDGNTECFTIDVLNYDKPIQQLELFIP